MTHNINEIRARLAHGGARPALFECLLTNPISPVADLLVPFMFKSASIPSSTINPIPVPYYGRTIFVPGERPDFEPWVTTIMNDEDFAIRETLEQWHNSINALERNISTNGSEPAKYKTQATVTQFSRDGSELRIYQLNGLWPSQITGIDLDWGIRDQIEEFQVSWSYDNFEVVGGTTGIGGGK